jgi:hypothetical protein
MAGPSEQQPLVSRSTLPISQLQGDAWAAWNQSYHAESRDAYRTLGKTLYQQDVRDRISALFARSDAQNARLDALARAS